MLPNCLGLAVVCFSSQNAFQITLKQVKRAEAKVMIQNKLIQTQVWTVWTHWLLIPRQGSCCLKQTPEGENSLDDNLLTITSLCIPFTFSWALLNRYKNSTSGFSSSFNSLNNTYRLLFFKACYLLIDFQPRGSHWFYFLSLHYENDNFNSLLETVKPSPCCRHLFVRKSSVNNAVQGVGTLMVVCSADNQHNM